MHNVFINTAIFLEKKTGKIIHAFSMQCDIWIRTLRLRHSVLYCCNLSTNAISVYCDILYYINAISVQRDMWIWISQTRHFVRLETRRYVGWRQLSTEKTTDRFNEMSQPNVLPGIDNGKRFTSDYFSVEDN